MDYIQVKTKEQREEEQRLNALRNVTPINEEASYDISHCYCMAVKNLPDPLTHASPTIIAIRTKYFGYIVFEFKIRIVDVENIEIIQDKEIMQRAKMYYWELESMRANPLFNYSPISFDPPEEINYTRTMDGIPPEFSIVSSEIAGQARNEGEKEVKP